MAKSDRKSPFRFTSEGTFSGLAIFAVMVFIAWAGIAFEAKRDLRNSTSELLDTWLTNIDSGNRLYAELEKIPEADCSDTHLRKLNTRVFKNNHITNIWFFPDGGTRAACSSSFGRFEPAHDFGPPEKAVLFKDGRETWYRVPIDVVEGVETVTLIKKGRYAVSFFQTGNLPAAEEDLLYVSAASAPYKVLYRANGNIELVDTYKTSLGPIFGDTFAQACDGGPVRLCYLTMIPLERVLQQNLYLLAVFALFSTLTGFLVFQRVNRFARERRSPTGRIRRAILNGGAGFEAHYQPIVTLETMTCEGCEVLARFEDAQGKLFPDEFINVVQAQNLTWEFTEIIISKALKDLAPLLTNRPDFKVSVNFFHSDLDDEESENVLKSKVLAAAKEARFSICCEILETGIRSGSSISQSLDCLRSNGFQIAVDDFGTGYSNLAQIQALKPDLVKIDKMFIDELSQDTASARGAFLHAILNIAAAHELKLCAEGVETLEQLTALRNLRVDFAQGYYFAKPMPVREFALYLLEQTFKEKQPVRKQIAKVSSSAQ